MKARSFLIALLLPVLASAAPSVSIEEAIKLAQGELKSRGVAGQVYIASVVLEGGRSPRWAVNWSGDVALDGERKESGLRIDMSGNIAHVVRGPANRNPVTGEFDPNGRRGLQNHRTRSDRPSILDLKH